MNADLDRTPHTFETTAPGSYQGPRRLGQGGNAVLCLFRNQNLKYVIETHVLEEKTTIFAFRELNS